MANSDYYIEDNTDIEDKKLEAAKGLYQSGNYKGALKLYLDLLIRTQDYENTKKQYYLLLERMENQYWILE